MNRKLCIEMKKRGVFKRCMCGLCNYEKKCIKQQHTEKRHEEK